MGARALLKWLGMGIAIGALVLAAFVLLINLTDDAHSSVRPAINRTSMTADRRVAVGPGPRESAKAVAAATVAAASGTDFELPDDTAGAPPHGLRTTVAKTRPAARSAPPPAASPAAKAFIRNAPF